MNTLAAPSPGHNRPFGNAASKLYILAVALVFETTTKHNFDPPDEIKY